jgi:hypothetical protein
MKKIAQKMLLSFIALSVIESASALDSGTQNLTSAIGATDYFKINCADDTDHLNFKLFENGATAAPVETPIATPISPILPQVLNAKLTKLKLTSSASAIAAGTNKNLTLKGGGNGAYTLTLDTFGTNLTIKTAQTYSVQYQCLSSTGKVTIGSSTLVKQSVESVKKTLANGKTAKYVINCAKDKTNGDTASLSVKIINKTAVPKIAIPAITIIPPVIPTVSEPSGNLTAQVIKGAVAKNTVGDAIDIENGNGNYDVLVNSPTNKALAYHFQYSCLNTKNVETKTSPFQLLQDQ